jgi:hypothetical protein
MTSSGIDVPAPSELEPTVPRYFQMIATMWRRTPLGKRAPPSTKLPAGRASPRRAMSAYSGDSRIAHQTRVVMLRDQSQVSKAARKRRPFECVKGAKIDREHGKHRGEPS